MRTSQLEKAKNQISQFFEANSKRAYTEKALEIILSSNRDNWKIPGGKKVTDFADFLVKSLLMEKSIILKNDSANPITIFTWKSKDDLTILNGLRNGSYFSHYTAMSLHSLTEQIPKSIYLNHEHSKPISESKPSLLSQNSIDQAFSKEQRKSDDIYSFNNRKIFLLNGKYTKRLGVINRIQQDQSYSFTDLHRTLIDIAIRPSYSGGVFEVLQAYENAKNSVDPYLIKKYLDKLNYIYPYHQVIGFYLEKAGYDNKILKIFNEKINYKFYLTYNIRNPQLDERWNLYFPKGM